MFTTILCALLASAANPWDPAPGSMDAVSTYSFSQSGLGDAVDPQIAKAGANLNIRTYSAWDNGAKVSEYNPDHLSKPKAAGVVPTGGVVATIVFRNEAPDDSSYLDWISRDALGDTVPHDEIVVGVRRGNLACPGYREHLMSLVRTQIDFGAVGIFFDEIDGGYNGGAKWQYNGNEGFDDYHLKEFNRWLVRRHPAWAKADFVKAFGMDSANALDPAKPLDDLVGNFNYRTYLATRKWSKYPQTSANPLGNLYGKPVGNRMVLHADNFLDSSNTAHWRETVAATRTYARSKGREILVTSNGIEPFVDFNSFGLYNYNKDGAGGSYVDYVPVSGKDLDGTVSLLGAFQSIRRNSKIQSGDAPVAVFLDWPTDMINTYYGLSAHRKMDYWRIHGAEAYAAGIFFAFHLRTSMPGEPTARESGILDSLENTISFYKSNADLFHGLQWDLGDVAVSLDRIDATRAWQASPKRWVVHLVNHHDSLGLRVRKALEVSLALDSAAKSVTMVSPDEGSGKPRSVPFSYAAGRLTISVDSLASSAILRVDMESPSGVARPQAASRARVRRCGRGWILEGLESSKGAVRVRLLDSAGRTKWHRRLQGPVTDPLEIPASSGFRVLRVDIVPPGGAASSESFPLVPM